MNFPSLGVRADIVSRLSELGINEPYPIQAATLVDGLAGRDLLAQSPTGSGKTLAFAIPLVTRVGKATRGRPRALVLAPTRELAAQIAAEIQPLGGVTGRTVATFYGGVGFGEQLSALRRGVDVAVGCPGRLIDLLERRSLDLRDVEIVVIDEVDRMSDMGFMPAVRQLLDEIRGAHQTMCFSATLSREVEKLVRDYQHDPARHVLGATGEQVGSREHEFWRTGRDQRAAVTAHVVGSYFSSIVFCRTKRGVDRLTKHLNQAGLAAVAIHGDRSQAQRDRALAQFRDGHAQVLVGTDVAARGLHVDDVDCVVHFDPPEDEDTYTHRSGRTGRAGSTGIVISIVTADQESACRKMQSRLGLGAEFRNAPAGPFPRPQNARPQPAPSRRPDGDRAPRPAPAKAAGAPGARRRHNGRPNGTSPKAGSSTPRRSGAPRGQSRRAS